MATPYLEKMAKEHSISIEDAERYWETAKHAASKAGHADDYAYITGVFKRIIKESEEVMRYVQTINKHLK